MNPQATFPLARLLRSPEGAPLGEVFSFVSGLYFRGKMTYARRFGRPPEGLSPGLVISAGEGLRFLHERVTLERLRSWAEVPIDERNPRFTAPLVAHATALRSALGDTTRFVLLGSVATDKYVRPLTEVFGDSLLFPPDFAGRGDMSRGGLLLRAARSGSELAYAPISNAERHGPRPPRLSTISAPPPSPQSEGLELVILVGLPGAGKSTFFRQRFADSHVHVSKDNNETRRRPEQWQSELLEQALGAGRSVVVDNTNVSVEQRAALISEAQRHGARVSGYFFESSTQECVNRNFGRQGKARVPLVGIFAAAKRLRPPTYGEGFDALYKVATLPDERFVITLEHPPRGDATPASERATLAGVAPRERKA
jgi:hypothetical protein